MSVDPLACYKKSKNPSTKQRERGVAGYVVVDNEKNNESADPP